MQRDQQCLRPLSLIEVPQPLEPRDPSDRCDDQGKQRQDNLPPKPELGAVRALLLRDSIVSFFEVTDEALRGFR